MRFVWPGRVCVAVAVAVAVGHNALTEFERKTKPGLADMQSARLIMPAV